VSGPIPSYGVRFKSPFDLIEFYEGSIDAPGAVIHKIAGENCIDVRLLRDEAKFSTYATLFLSERSTPLQIAPNPILSFSLLDEDDFDSVANETITAIEVHNLPAVVHDSIDGWVLKIFTGSSAPSSTHVAKKKSVRFESEADKRWGTW